MSEEQLKAFLEKVKGDTSLQEKLKEASDPVCITNIAKEHGHEFSSNTYEKLSEAELESLSGGAQTPNLCCCTAATFKVGYSGF